MGVFMHFRKSAWSLDETNSGSIKLVVSVTVGKLGVTSPNGEPHEFSYGAIGGGPSAGIKIPLKGKTFDIGRTVEKAVERLPLGKTINAREPSNAAFLPSAGTIMVHERLRSDLQLYDFQGLVVLVEAGGGIVAGASASFMLIGLADHWPDAPSLMAFLPQAGAFETLATSSAGIILSGGLTVSAQASIGATAYVGYMGVSASEIAAQRRAYEDYINRASEAMGVDLNHISMDQLMNVRWQ